MDITVPEIVSLYEQRKKLQGPLFTQMQSIRDLVNGGIVIPLPEINEDAKPAVANLVSQGVYQMARRFASVMPTPYSPILKEGSELSKKLARQRQKAIMSWYNANKMGMKLRRRGLHAGAYGRTAVTITWNPTTNIPQWKVRDPLDCYPAPVDDPDDMVPSDCIFTFRTTASWLLRNYGDKLTELRMGKVERDTKFVMLEYLSADCTQLIVLGQQEDPYAPTAGVAALGIEYLRNRTGLPQTVIADRVCLDELHGSYDDQIGMYFSRARLQAMNEIAIRRGIYPDTWVVSHPGEKAEIITTADGERGIMGEIKGGTVITQQLNPGYKTDSAIDRMELQERVQGNIPAELSGQSASNIRTGRRGENLLSSAIDPIIDETRATFEASMVEENRIAINIQKTYDGDKSISFFIPSRSKGVIQETYVPNKIWLTADTFVKYSPKIDMVEIGQRRGLKMISLETARNLDPLIEDAEHEHDTILKEDMEDAGLQSFLAQAQNPDGPYQPIDVAKMIKYVAEDDLPFSEAIIRVDQAARDRQAAQVPPQSPEAMPGLSMPGFGGESQPAPPPSLQQLVSQLRGG